MGLTILLLSLFGVLVGILLWLRVPRRQMFELLHISAWVYAISFFISLQIVARVAPQLADGFVPYILPVPVVALFVGWARYRQKTVQK